jgi:hypothetical protein
MKKAKLLILGAWTLFLIAWFLPAVKPQQDFTKPILGWKAFRLAACGVISCDGVEFQTRHHAALAGASAITTVIFLCSPLVVLRGSQSLRRWSVWIAVAAFLLNMHWIVTFGDQRSALSIGYFLWLLSFFLLAVGLFVSVRDKSK